MEFDLDKATAVLERTPETLRSLLLGLPEEWTLATDGGETWSAFDVMGHLIHGERTDWMARARIILEQGENRRFDPYDRFAQFRESEGKSLDTLLAEFAELRARNLEMVREWKLSTGQLDLVGEHPAFGPVTLRQLLATWVAHDLGHIVQITRTMARQYREEIGPWRQYLSVMDR